MQMSGCTLSQRYTVLQGKPVQRVAFIGICRLRQPFMDQPFCSLAFVGLINFYTVFHSLLFGFLLVDSM